jgi:hypothetical protein
VGEDRVQPPTQQRRILQRSWLWSFFRLNEKDPSSFFCILCSAEKSSKKRGDTSVTAGFAGSTPSTSNLRVHIRSCHPDLSIAIKGAEESGQKLDSALAERILQCFIDKAASTKIDQWLSYRQANR